jgi:CheY-like chemotaxis protein
MARILVIDDDPDLQHVIRIMLQRAGHSVLVASNGDTGLQTLRAEPVDLVICDVMMPDLDGYEVTRRLRADPKLKDVLVLVLTARAQPVDYEAAIEAGADAYLAKPVNHQQLNDKVGALLAAGRAAPGSDGAGRVLVCLGLRGGVGATTLAANLASIFALARRRVCLVDLSPASGHLALHFRLRPRPNWVNLPPAVAAEALGQYLLRHDSGVHLLAAPSQPVRQGLSEAVFAPALAGLRSLFGDVIVDAAPVLDGPTESALAAAAVVLVVLAPDVASVQTTTGTLRALRDLAVPDEAVRVVLNHVSPEPGLPQSAVEKALNREMNAVLPFDRGQAAALVHGTPLGLNQAASPLVAAVGQFAARL